MFSINDYKKTAEENKKPTTEAEFQLAEWAKVQRG